jgi:transposase
VGLEGADGMGHLLAQQLVATGEHVLNVSATLAAHTRLLGTGRSNKNDPNDALSVAITALRTRDLRPVQAVGHSEVLRLLAKRNRDIGDHRTRLVCRMHALLLELAAGAIAKEINASDVACRHERLLAWSPAHSCVGQGA